MFRSLMLAGGPSCRLPVTFNSCFGPFLEFPTSALLSVTEYYTHKYCKSFSYLSRFLLPRKCLFILVPSPIFSRSHPWLLSGSTPPPFPIHTKWFLWDTLWPRFGIICQFILSLDTLQFFITFSLTAFAVISRRLHVPAFCPRIRKIFMLRNKWK